MERCPVEPFLRIGQTDGDVGKSLGLAFQCYELVVEMIASARLAFSNFALKCLADLIHLFYQDFILAIGEVGVSGSRINKQSLSFKII